MFRFIWMASFEAQCDGQSSSKRLMPQVAKAHILHAWCGELQVCLGQYKTEAESNKITAIPALLDMLEVNGCLVSIDAMGCQKKEW